MKTAVNAKKTTLLNDDTYELLKKTQRDIQDKTGFSPSLKRLLNDIVNQESVRQLTERLVEKLS